MSKVVSAAVATAISYLFLSSTRDSVAAGRGAPVSPELPLPRGDDSTQLPGLLADMPSLLIEHSVVGPYRVTLRGEGGAPDRVVDVGSAFDGKTPEGIEPLPVDVFTTKDFYRDRALWSERIGTLNSLFA